MFGLIELHVCILNSIYEKGVSLTISLPALFRRSAMVEVLLTRITQPNIVKPVNSLSMKPNIIKPLVSFMSSSDLQIDAWHSNCNRTDLQHIENPRIVLCVYNIDIKPTGPHCQRSASPFPPLPPQLKARAHATKRIRDVKFPAKKRRLMVYFLATSISIAKQSRIAQKKCLPSRDRTAGLKITIDRFMQLQSCALPAELRRVGKRDIAC
jgi:hypothetical protein